MPIDVSSFPGLVADFLNIPELAASLLIAGFLVVCIFTLFAMIGKPTANVIFIGAMVVMGFCIVVEWLPVWFFSLVVLGIAFNVANKLKRYVS
jgi:ABC-type transport system involved in multi-copper enzyme maturation permease subunit